jgi:hypothetical protein
LVVLCAACGTSAPRRSDAVPFARNFILTVFPRGASCKTIAGYSRQGTDNCASVKRLSHYFMTTPFPTVVKKCTGLLPDGKVVVEQCLDFQVIAHAASTSGWSFGTLSLGVGQNHHGQLVIDGVAFEGGDCLAGDAECQHLWDDRVQP